MQSIIYDVKHLIINNKSRIIKQYMLNYGRITRILLHKRCFSIVKCVNNCY